MAALIGTLAFAADRNDGDSMTPSDSAPTQPATTVPPPATSIVPPEATDAADTTPSTPATSNPATSTPDTELTPTTAPPPRSSWTPYESDRYSFTLRHPPSWTAAPSSRLWNWETDIEDWRSTAHEAFISPDDAIRVSVWNAPFDANSPVKSSRSDVSRTKLVAWVEDYCEQSGNSPCDRIADRAIDLCVEKWDCHPGLLVAFENDVQAFVTGGIYSGAAMTVVAVWRGESAPAVAPYGGAQQLLESFLATMEVWPATTPREERVCVEISDSNPGGWCD